MKLKQLLSILLAVALLLPVMPCQGATAVSVGDSFTYTPAEHWGVTNDIWSWQWALADTEDFQDMKFKNISGQGDCYVADWDKYPYCAARKEGINVHPNEDADSARVFTAPASGWITVTATTTHNYQSQEVPPTCTTEGYTQNTCIHCGHIYISNRVPTTGHSYAVIVTKNPACATSQLKGSDTKLKQLVVAMLNYGAEAQLYFGHNTGNLANVTLSAEQKALPAAYNSGMVSTVASAPAAKQGIFANNQGFSKRTPSISFEGAFSINYFFTPKYTPDSGITMYYWTAEDYNANSVLTTSNATGKIKLEGSGTGQYQGDIEGIAAKALSEAVYVACAYKSGGTVWTSGVLGYSIGAYRSSQASKGTAISNLAMATAVYGYQAKAYFG